MHFVSCHSSLSSLSTNLLFKQTIHTILETLRSPSRPLEPADKLRLVLMFYLSRSVDNALSKDDIAELEKELKSAGVGLGPFEYVRKVREVERMGMGLTGGGLSGSATGGGTPSGGAGDSGGGGELFKGFSALGNRVRSRKSFVGNCALIFVITTCSSQTDSTRRAWRVFSRA